MDMDRVLEQLEEIFVEGGILSRIFPGYEPRTQQIELAKQIYRSFEKGNHLFAEAGTGTGKSFAYLIAAALWALENEGTVLISTHTLPLQSQLVEKDLPVVARVMEQLGYEEFRYELAKGRSHYICKRRLENLVQEILQKDHPHRDLIEKIAIHTLDAEIGSRDEYPFRIPAEIWEEICGDSDDCFHQHSPFYDSCFIQQARRRWARAHLIVANHALVFSDLALKMHSENGVLPNYDRLVFDEGHRVEEVFSRFFERSMSLSEMEQIFRLIRQRKQGWMRTVLDDEIIAEIEVFHREIRQKIQPLFERLAEDLRTAQEKQGVGPFEPVMEMVKEPIPVPEEIQQPIRHLLDYLETIRELRCTEEPEKRGMQRLMRLISGIGENIAFVLERQGNDDWAHWIEKVPPPQAGLLDLQAEWVRLVAQPIQARSVLQELFHKVPVAFISATLSTNRNFAFISNRLGIDEYDQFIADSPFDFQKQALLVISETAPDPRDAEAFEQFLIEGLKRVIAKTQGRTLVLFTSYALLDKVAQGIAEWMEAQGIELLVHQPQSEREPLIAAFKSGENKVLFGCESFWEGIDIPGPALSCVVITKLPFANPSEPLVKAKIDILEKQGRNSFVEYMIPTAILKMKQGFGRLIRTMEDRGTVVIMDSRILKKHYGRQILNSLPPAKRGKLKDIPLYMPKS